MYAPVLGSKGSPPKTVAHSTCESELIYRKDVCSVTLDSLACHGILQARILEWVAISFSRRSF